ncbi:MAG TPA: PKD domain-containing protein [Anaerolineae bacterium]|nr:PKD domain-containing protein [Anaerolineae bacterium]HQI83927.1 PKD domain-containing protein [Anaerolineae bacterium]
MVKKVQTSTVSNRARVRYGFGAAGIGIAALLFLLFFSRATQGLAAPLAPTAVTIGKSSVTSIVATNNALNQAVAGELVTVTVIYTVSGETIYAASPRVVLEDGLLPTGSSPTWSNMYTGTQTALRGYEGSGTHITYQSGALVIFPDQGTITGTDKITMTVYAVRTQRRYALPPYAEITDGTNLRIQGILRYCFDPSCSSPGLQFTVGTDAAGQVTAKQPLVNTTYGAPVYLDALGIGEGGGQVRLTFTAAANTGRPTAYDIVYTATLNAGLTYFASSGGNGAGAGTVSTVGDVTYVVWNVPVSLLNPQTWQAVVTATLANPFTIGQQFTYLGTAAYQTFAGDVPYEGKYVTAGALQTLRPGLSTVIKTSNPGSGAVTMGDVVTYTVVFRQGANTLLQAPQVVDTQPLGFHYITDTFALQNAPLISFVTQAGGTGNVYESLKWMMSDLVPIGQARVVTATYATLNTGLDYNGTAVYVLAANLTASMPTINGSVTGAVLSWTPPVGSSYSSATRANAGALGVIQPYTGDQFRIVLTNAGPFEVNDRPALSTRFHNLGALVSGKSITAYELEICNTLPPGLVFAQKDGCFVNGTTTECPFKDAVTWPAVGAEGTICWQVPALDRTTTLYEFKYQANVTNGVYPGLQNTYAFVTTYSSQAGEVVGERVYSDIAAALPYTRTSFTVLGLAASKTAVQSHVAPGNLITYVIAYTDTSAANSYSGLMAVDTYDPLLTYKTATPAPDSHNVGARELTWNLGSLPPDGNGQITLVMQVLPEIAGRYMLTNTVLLDSDQTAPRTWVVTTPIDVASLHVSMSGPQFTHAGGNVAYTVVYSNTGSWNNAPVTLTLDYDPYLTYVSSSRTPVAGTDNKVFTDTVPNNGSNKTLTINFVTAQPLPFTLAEVRSSVNLSSSGAPSQNDAWTTLIQRPVFTFRKLGQSAASQVGNPMQYTFELVNTGTYTATNLVITDTWDVSTSFLTSPGWTPAGAGTYATYTIASLAPGVTATVNPLTVKVDGLQDSYLNQADLRSAQTTVQHTEVVVWSHSIALRKTAYPVPAFPGRVLTYTLYYTNTGVGVVYAVIVDTLPAGFSYQGQSTASASGCASAWNFEFNSPYATWSCTSMVSGATGHFQIWGEVTADENEVLVNYAESDGADIPTRPIDAPLETLVARPKLSVTKVGAPTHPVAPGDTVTYTLTYTNSGSYAAYGVVIKDQLPDQLAFVGCNHSCTHQAGLVTWTIGEVPVATTGQVVVYATVKSGRGGQTAVNEDYTIENTTVWQRLLPSETYNGAPVETTILDPHVSVTKTATPALVTQVNAPITYTIQYVNDGGGTLTNVTLSDVLSTMTLFHTASPGCSWSGTGLGGTVTCSLGDLDQGETGTVRIVVLASVQGLITNTAVIDSDQTAPLETTPPTEVFYSTGGCIPPYNVNFTVSPNPKAGEPITFTASASGDAPLAYAWTFGDTQNGSGQVVYHTYAVSGTYTVKLTVSNSCAPAGINVQKNVYAPGAPELSWNPPSLSKTTAPGSLAVLTDTLTVSNIGSDNLLWSIEVTPSATSWLSIAAGGGTPAKVLSGFNTAPAGQVPVTVYFDPTGLAGGTYTAHLRITSNDADEGVVEIPVSFTVDSGAAEINWNPPSFSKTTAPGSLLVLSDTLTVSNTGTIALLWSIEVTPSATSWLSIAAGGAPVKVLSGFSTAPGGQVPVTVYFNPAGLAGGTYTAHLRITSNDVDEGVVEIPVSFTVDPGAAEIDWRPASLTASVEEGSTSAVQRTLTVSNTGTIALTWSIEVTPTTATWLKFSVNGSDQTAYLPGLSTAPGASTPVTVYFNPTGLTQGDYNAWLRIASNDADEGVVLVPVTFTVVKSNYFIFLPLVLRNN